MARMRSLKPEFWSDLKLARLSRDARLLYMALWNQADEWGRLHGDTRFVKGHCLPYDDDLTLGSIDVLLAELAAAGRVVRYDHEGDPYLFLPTLGKHQRLEPDKVKSRLPEPPTERDSDESAPPSESRANESAPNAESSETIVAKHVACGMEHVAGSRTAPRGQTAATSDPPGFAEFWQAYPRKVEKQAALKAYRKALKTTTAEQLLEGARQYAAQVAGSDPSFTKHPTSWLNAGCWDDEPAPLRLVAGDMPNRSKGDPHKEWMDRL